MALLPCFQRAVKDITLFRVIILRRQMPAPASAHRPPQAADVPATHGPCSQQTSPPLVSQRLQAQQPPSACSARAMSALLFSPPPPLPQLSLPPPRSSAPRPQPAAPRPLSSPAQHPPSTSSHRPPHPQRCSLALPQQPPPRSSPVAAPHPRLLEQKQTR